jgi:AraC-like DNA-binding protein
MTLLKHFPASPLSEIVELFWYSARDPAARRSASREAILPDGCAHLVINLSENRIGLYERIKTTRLTTLEGGIFSGPRSFPYAILPAAAAVIGVAFRPGGVVRLLAAPTEEFRDTQVPLEFMTGGDELRDRLIGAPTVAASFLLMEKFLLRQLQQSRSLHRVVRYAVDAFEQTPCLSVATVLKQIGFSERRFSRIFSEQVGLTPKLFQRVRRFQKTMTSLPLHGDIDWAATAFANGYYDQAHFINDFRAFTSVTPSVFLAQRIAQRNHLPLPD